MIGSAARRASLYAAFTFTGLPDPVSSVAYAIEAALGKLSNDLTDIALTMGLSTSRGAADSARPVTGPRRAMAPGAGISHPADRGEGSTAAG